jgi:hypothetical protein
VNTMPTLKNGFGVPTFAKGDDLVVNFLVVTVSLESPTCCRCFKVERTLID